MDKLGEAVNDGSIKVTDEEGLMDENDVRVIADDLLNFDTSLFNDRRLPGEYSSCDFNAHQLKWTLNSGSRFVIDVDV